MRTLKGVHQQSEDEECHRLLTHLRYGYLDLAKDIPLADSAQWDRLRGEVDALVATYRDHRDFVYSSGTEGRPLKRVCDCCKRYVYLSTSDRYTLWSGEVHETCIRPKPGEAEAAVAG